MIFRLPGIDLPISGNVLDFPISGNQFQMSENRHPTEARHSTSPQHHPTTPPTINNGTQQYLPHLLVETVITTYYYPDRGSARSMPGTQQSLRTTHCHLTGVTGQSLECMQKCEAPCTTVRQQKSQSRTT